MRNKLTVEYHPDGTWKIRDKRTGEFNLQFTTLEEVVRHIINQNPSYFDYRDILPISKQIKIGTTLSLEITNA